MKRVVLRSTFVFHGDEAERPDEECIEDAKEAFYLDGADVHAHVEEVDVS